MCFSWSMNGRRKLTRKQTLEEGNYIVCWTGQKEKGNGLWCLPDLGQLRPPLRRFCGRKIRATQNENIKLIRCSVSSFSFGQMAAGRVACGHVSEKKPGCTLPSSSRRRPLFFWRLSISIFVIALFTCKSAAEVQIHLLQVQAIFFSSAGTLPIAYCHLWYYVIILINYV